METKRALLAVLISLAILLGYQYFFVPAPPPPEERPINQPTAPETDESVRELLPPPPAGEEPVGQAEVLTAPEPPAAPRKGRDIPVETALYSAVISETGGGFKSFKLKNYQESLASNSDFKELITTAAPAELPSYFSWGVEPDKTWVPVFEAQQEAVILAEQNREGSLVLQSKLPSGIEITKTYHFDQQDYRIGLVVDVRNTSKQPLQGAPYLRLTNQPFSQQKANRFLFTGPAYYMDQAMQEVKVDDLQEEGARLLRGQLNWAAYMGPYFITAALPLSDDADQQTVRFAVADEQKVTTLLSESPALIPPQGRIQYNYTLYFGPKKLSILKNVDHELAAAVDFGWFDILAKPMLYLLNFFYNFVHNYGVAIILVTVIIKLLFWPIAARGMKSMKTMQKLQPKIAKLKEKYGDDRERMNQEMIKLYQTYKINPVGGCLPMVLQIPVFFALYKVLLQTIELRHAPFMLWINDLSAPDRLYLGFDIPYLGGLPVLTLLMGGSMFLQQKMTPTSPDPTQAKVMLFLPVLFTFMFINFASGLVLYWFVNNLLSMAQQSIINRQFAAEG